MKNYIVLLLAFLPLALIGATDRTSQTFMFPHPLHHNIAATSGAYDVVVTKKGGGNCCVVQAIPLYEESFDFREENDNKNFNKCCAKSYFLLDCKSELSVVNDSQANEATRDIRADWLGLTGIADGKLALCPEQRSVGVILTANQDIKAWIDWDFLGSWWVDLSIPIVNTKTRLNTTGTSAEVLASFQRNNLNYAQLLNSTESKTSIPEIKLTLGGTYLNDNGFLLTYYTGVALPTERKPKPDYLFPATLGNNGHLNLITGINSKLPLMDPVASCEAQFFFNIENHHYIPNHQCRTVDLKNKQYSRYLLVRREGESATTPAANILTPRVKVSPHSFVDMTTGLEFSSNRFRFEVAYDLWGHGDEQIELDDAYCDSKVNRTFENYGIAGTGTSSASASTIKTLAANDSSFVTIKERDLDFASASGRGVVVHGAHAAAYYRDVCRDQIIFFGLGAFYKKPNGNTALEEWGVWGKIGYEF